MLSERPAIVAESLGKTYVMYAQPLDRLKQYLTGGKRKYGRSFHALSDVSFVLRKGQVLGLIGNNGAGKSTLLQLVCQTLKPTSGHLEVNGRVAALLELGAGFNPEFSGRENVHLNAAVLGLSGDEIAARFDSIVAFSGIGDFIEQPVKTYSSGMYVRLAFSIATSVEPDILIIDEALSVGDGGFARQSFDRIMALKNSGATILFCSHSMYHIEAICDQALWLDKGKTVMMGKPSEVTDAYRECLVQSNQTTQAPAQTSELIAGAGGLTAPKGTARILKIAFDVDGNVKSPFQIQSGQSHFEAKVFYQIDSGLPSPSVFFVIETATGMSVSSGSTLFDGYVPSTDSTGHGMVALEFENIPLMRGKYFMTIYLVCEKGVHVYEEALNCAEINVTQSGVEQGVVFLDHAWQ